MNFLNIPFRFWNIALLYSLLFHFIWNTQVVVISLRSIYDLIRESRISHPVLCHKVLKALLDILQNLPPESLLNEPSHVVGKSSIVHFELLMSIQFLSVIWFIVIPFILRRYCFQDLNAVWVVLTFVDVLRGLRDLLWFWKINLIKLNTEFFWESHMYGILEKQVSLLILFLKSTFLMIIEHLF